MSYYDQILWNRESYFLKTNFFDIDSFSNRLRNWQDKFLADFQKKTSYFYIIRGRLTSKFLPLWIRHLNLLVFFTLWYLSFIFFFFICELFLLGKKKYKEKELQSVKISLIFKHFFFFVTCSFVLRYYNVNRKISRI